eukprot:Em0011g168a
MDTYGAITVRRSVMASEIFLCARKQCYDAVAKEPSLRFSQEIDLLAGWLNEKGEILKHLSKDELRSLAAVVRLKDFYIILRGTVAILVDQVESFNGYTRQSTQNLRKGSTLDRLLHTSKTDGQELNTTVSEMRRSYGTELRNLFPGDHFGDVALLLTNSISPNTFMSNDLCQVLAIGKEAFHKYLATHLQSALLKKAYFVASHRLLEGWTPAFVRQLSASLRERKLKFQDILFQEGSDLRSVYFIKSGSFKLSASSNKMPSRDLINRAKDCTDCTLDNRGGRPSTTIAWKSRVQRPPLRPATSQIHLSPPSLPSSPSMSRLRPQKPTPRRRYRLHEPSPPSTGVCVSILGPGDLLGGTEAVCQLRHLLFTAVGMGKTTVYELDVHSFRYLLTQRHQGTLHALVGDLLQRAGEWERRLPSLPWIGLVTRVLGQIQLHLEGRGVHRRYRDMRYPPDAVAMAAMKVSASKDALSSQESSLSSDDLAQELPRVKRRLHPFDSPPPPPCDSWHTGARLEPFFPCAYVPRPMTREGWGSVGSGGGCSTNRMMVFDLEDGGHADMAAIGLQTHDSSASSHSNLRFTPQSTFGTTGCWDGVVGGGGHQANGKPLDLTRSAWGPPLESGTCTGTLSTPTPAAGTNSLFANKETNLSSLKSEGQIEICAEQKENGPDQSQHGLKSQPRDNLPSLQPLFPSISSTAHQQGANSPHRTAQPSPHCPEAAALPQPLVPLQVQMKSFEGEGSLVVTAPQPLQPSCRPTDTQQDHRGTSQQPSLDASVSSANTFQVPTWVDPAAPKRLVGTPPHRAGDAPMGRHGHWRLPCIPQTLDTSPWLGTSQYGQQGPPRGSLDTLCSAMDLVQNQRSDQSSEGAQEQSAAPTVVQRSWTTPPLTTPPLHAEDVCQLPSALCPSLVSCPPAELHAPPTTPIPDSSVSAESFGHPVTEESRIAETPDPKMMAESPGPSVTPEPLGPPTSARVLGRPLSQGPNDPSLATGPMSPSPLHSADDANTDAAISAMWEVPINVFMREKTNIGRLEGVDLNAKRADLGPSDQLHSQQKSVLGARRTPGGGAHAYVQNRSRNYPLHRLWSNGGAVRPQQGVQPRRSIIDLAFEQAQDKPQVVPKPSVAVAPKYRLV